MKSVIQATLMALYNWWMNPVFGRRLMFPISSDATIQDATNQRGKASLLIIFHKKDLIQATRLCFLNRNEKDRVDNLCGLDSTLMAKKRTQKEKIRSILFVIFPLLFLIYGSPLQKMALVLKRELSPSYCGKCCGISVLQGLTNLASSPGFPKLVLTVEARKVADLSAYYSKWSPSYMINKKTGPTNLAPTAGFPRLVLTAEV